MKKYNKVIVFVVVFYVLLGAFAGQLIQYTRQTTSNQYQVEINRIYQGLVERGSFIRPDLSEYKYVCDVSFLENAQPEASDEKREEIDAFYTKKNALNLEIRPFFLENQLIGYLRFDYENKQSGNEILYTVEGLITILAIVTLGLLLYIRREILKPFNMLSNMPYELSKGHLKGELKESKSKYYGKFVWGLGLLRDHLNSHKVNELKLEKEKKLMLLSISHDIKTPVSTIKLYAKALEEDVYESPEQRKHAALQIGEKAGEIDHFVKEIMKTSSEDILNIEVEQGEFYLKDLVNKIDQTYKGKCNLLMTEFTVGKYENHLIKGDIERALEVAENIMENAFKYGDGKRIAISFYEEDYCQLMKIHNSGQAVSENEFNHIFDSFFRGSNTTGKEGNGLGLYICKEIMKKMDGEIFAEREEDGMSFVVVFR